MKCANCNTDFAVDNERQEIFEQIAQEVGIDPYILKDRVDRAESTWYRGKFRYGQIVTFAKMIKSGF